MPDEKEPDQYEVGYKKPPASSQFRTGVSGNPRGRRRKCVPFDDQVIKHFESVMVVNENGCRVRISKTELMLKQQLKKAIKGNPQAIRTCLNLLEDALDREGQRNPPDTGYIELLDGAYLTDEELKLWGLNLTTRDLAAVRDMDHPEILAYLRMRLG